LDPLCPRSGTSNKPDQIKRSHHHSNVPLSSAGNQDTCPRMRSTSSWARGKDYFRPPDGQTLRNR
jgi:hypothetical protein